MFCHDRIICKRTKAKRNVVLRELTEAGRIAALELLEATLVKRKRARAHPFPMKQSLARLCWELCLDEKGTTIFRLERECRRVGGDIRSVLRRLRMERIGKFTWEWCENKAGEVRIIWNPTAS